MKPSTYYVHMKTKILADFLICISVLVITLSTSILKDKTAVQYSATQVRCFR